LKCFVALIPELKQRRFGIFHGIEKTGWYGYAPHRMVDLDSILIRIMKANHSRAGSLTYIEEPVSFEFRDDFNYLDHL